MIGGKGRRVVTALLAWNDLLLSLLGCLLILLAIFLAIINEVKKETKTDDDKAAGNISVYLFWPDGIDLDIDTHLRAPDGEHIYFGNLAGPTWNLLRDDTGMPSSIDGRDPRNFENAYTRGLPAGEYVVNVHSYRGTPAMYPVVIEAEVRITADPTKGKAAQKIVTQKVTLYRTGEEATAVRFTIDANMNLVTGSVNHVFKPIMKRNVTW